MTYTIIIVLCSQYALIFSCCFAFPCFLSSWRTAFYFQFWKKKGFTEYGILYSLSPSLPPLHNTLALKRCHYVVLCLWLLGCFQDFSLLLVLSSFTLMCLNVVFTVFILLGFHRTSLVCEFMFIIWKILLFLNLCYIFLSLFPPFLGETIY